MSRVTEIMDENKFDIIIFSTADWGHKYLTNKQHVAKGLAEKGYRVLYVESFGLRVPGINRKDLVRVFNRLIKGIISVKKAEKNIWVFSPLLIPFKHNNKIIQRINKFILITIINFAINILNFKNICIWTYHPVINDILPYIKYKISVYHIVDRLISIPGIDSCLIDNNDKKLCENVDIIFVTSRNLEQIYSCNYTNKVFYFSNVADVFLFSKARHKGKIPNDIINIPSPIISYIGVLSDFKVNFKLIYEICKKKQEWSWVFIGEEREGQQNLYIKKLKKMSNIYFIGYKKYELLPDYLRKIDIAVIPNIINDYTHFMFPIKFFEYIAAGKPVISTSIPALKEYKKLYLCADDADSFIGCVEKILLNRNSYVCRLEDVLMYSYSNRLELMLKTINSTLGAAGQGRIFERVRSPPRKG